MKYYDDLVNNRAYARFVATNQEKAYLVNAINSNVGRKKLLDKFEFFLVCKHNGIPSIPIFVHAINGEAYWPSSDLCGSSDSLAYDVVCKPCEGQKGEGIILCSRKEDGRFETEEGLLTSRQLIEYVKRKTIDKGRHIVQPRLINHEAIRSFSPTCLCTIRVLTGMDSTGKTVPFQAFLRLGLKDSIVDNVNAGGGGASVDVESGVLGGVVSTRNQRLRSSGELWNGQVVKGTVVPFWREVLDLCVDAHSVFSEYAFIGWDVAILDEGPVLVEANDHPAVDLLQSASGKPFGLTSYYEIANDRLSMNGG
ncbi:sugar-transfer associated ATP-grasp domain-containing protein [Aquisalimonas lutea]|uniref:sugar-transfer associated ATP-grasp domain-containing protein n=1 Tax=Aquisalimonas lutea TaxID=1327750 RepID=UPI0025B46A01|nr:sugar-transfer associated ATP-grasp domain-containing protein [Aquisalimonas lutea]MDN3517198.1 sugar-transfer associated ATP-grasp domain-containing protein [Aquisalimonas lutea]